MIMFSMSQVSSSDARHELYEAAEKLLLCLDSLTGLLLTRDSAGENESDVMLLQQEVTHKDTAHKYTLSLH